MVVVAALLVVELPVSAFVERDRQRRLAARFVVPTRTVAAGDALAVLQVEKIGLNEVVVRGDGSNLLRSGPGLRPGTPAPGAPGNSVIVGRRLRYGAPMARLRELARGDEIVVWVRSTPHPVAFRVTRTRHVDGSSRPPAAAGDARLTLVTAAPGLPTSDLLLVEAELVGAAPKATSSVGASGRDGRPGTWVSPARRSGYAAGAAAWITVLLCLPVGFRWLRRRLRRAAARAVVAPVAAVAIVGLALALEGIIPRLV
jgi:sortase A